MSTARHASRAERLAKIEEMLFHHPEGMRVVEIAGACRVDRRTVYRDLAALERTGMPLRQEDGRYSIIREQYLATLRLDLHELITLFLAVCLLSSSSSSPNPHLVSVLEKLGEALAEPLVAQARAVAEQVRALPANPAFAAVLDLVVLAWFRRRKVRLWQSTAQDEEADYCEVSPYFVKPTVRGEMLLFGREDVSGEVQVIDLCQVTHAQVLDVTAEGKSGYTPDCAAHHMPGQANTL